MHELTMSRARSRSRPSWLCGLLLLAWSSASAAEGGAPREAAAEVLYDRGLASMRAGQFEAGCKQLEQSQALDAGIGTMLHLAECYSFLGRFASAWTLYREAASLARAAGPLERARAGDALAAKLEGKLSWLKLEVSPGDDMPGFVIQLNGSDWPRTAWGVSVPIDAGDVSVQARAPGYQSFAVQELDVRPGSRTVVNVPALLRAPMEVVPAADGVQKLPPPAALAPAAVAAAAPRAAVVAVDSAPRWQRPTGLATGAVGLVVAGVGGYFGLHAMARNREARRLCASQGTRCSDAHGLAASAEANADARRANWLIAGGLVATAAGAVLWLTAPSETATQLEVHAGARSLTLDLTGAF